MKPQYSFTVGGYGGIIVLGASQYLSGGKGDGRNQFY